MYKLTVWAGDTIAVPDGGVAAALGGYELTHVLRYKEDLATDQVEEAVQRLFDMGLEWVQILATMMRRAV